MRDYIQINFVDKGMCAQFAIHDSENPKTGQRNLHCHIMLTMRSLDEQGKWMPKQKKVYLTDENGERIPLIDKRTGQQKVDKQNRKQWKCATVSTNDWSSREDTMFGIDWDGDGKESLFDDMVTLDILEDEDEDDCRGGGTPNGSCLIFVVGIGAAIATPIYGIIKFLV